LKSLERRKGGGEATGEEKRECVNRVWLIDETIGGNKREGERQER